MFRAASRGVLAVAATVFLISALSPAQEFLGTIIGTVSDPTGGVLPGVTVTVTNTETHVAQTIVTDAQGLYQVRYRPWARRLASPAHSARASAHA